MKLNKKAIIWTLVYIGAAYGVYKLFFEKKDDKKPPMPPLKDASGKPTIEAYKQLEANVGKTAYAISNGTNIRSEPKVNNGVINNIIKTIKADEPVGVITSLTIGADNYIWYMFKVNGKTAYVRSTVVSIK